MSVFEPAAPPWPSRMLAVFRLVFAGPGAWSLDAVIARAKGAGVQ